MTTPVLNDSGDACGGGGGGGGDDVDNFVTLQPSTPGIPDTGNWNISGTGLAANLWAKLHDAGGQVFNVQNFGAVGNGVADDTASIQAAIAAAAHGIIFLPAGIYKVSDTLDLSANQGAWLMGAGYGNTIIRTVSATVDVVRMSPPAGNTGIVPGTAVSDLWIQAGVTRTAGAMLTIGNSEQSYIGRVLLGYTDYQNVSAFNTGDGIVINADVTSGQIVFLENFRIGIRGPFCGLKNTDSNGTFLASHGVVSGPSFNGGTVTGSRGVLFGGGSFHMEDIDFDGFEIGVDVNTTGVGSTWNTAHNVYADTNTLYGWNFQDDGGGISGISLINCWAGSNGTDATGIGLRIANGTRFIIEGFRAVNNLGHGIFLGGATVQNIEITGGFCYNNSSFANNTKDGIFVSDEMTGLRIIGMHCDGVQRYGINISGAACDDFIVTNNDLRGNATGAINNAAGSGSSKIVANNLPAGTSSVIGEVENQVACTLATAINSTTPVDITGCTITFTPSVTCKALVVGTFDVEDTSTSGTSTFVGTLDINGTPETAEAIHCAVGPNGRGTYSQTWTPSLTGGTPYTMKLRGQLNSGAAVYTVQQDHTTLSILAIGGF